jgi:di/tripeptidase
MLVVQLTAEVFEELNNSPPELKAIHAGACACGSAIIAPKSNVDVLHLKRAWHDLHSCRS